MKKTSILDSSWVNGQPVQRVETKSTMLSSYYGEWKAGVDNGDKSCMLGSQYGEWAIGVENEDKELYDGLLW